MNRPGYDDGRDDDDDGVVLLCALQELCATLAWRVLAAARRLRAKARVSVASETPEPLSWKSRKPYSYFASLT